MGPSSLCLECERSAHPWEETHSSMKYRQGNAKEEGTPRGPGSIMMAALAYTLNSHGFSIAEEGKGCSRLRPAWSKP